MNFQYQNTRKTQRKSTDGATKTKTQNTRLSISSDSGGLPLLGGLLSVLAALLEWLMTLSG